MLGWVRRVFRRKTTLALEAGDVPAQDNQALAITPVLLAEPQPEAAPPSEMKLLAEAAPPPISIIQLPAEPEPIRLPAAEVERELELEPPPTFPDGLEETTFIQLLAVETGSKSVPTDAIKPAPLLETPPPPPKELERRKPMDIDKAARSAYFGSAYGQPTLRPRVLMPPDYAFRMQRSAAVQYPQRPVASEPPPITPPIAVAPAPAGPLQRFVTGGNNPPSYQPGKLLSLDPALFSVYFLSMEGSQEVPASAGSAYLTEASLLKRGWALRDSVLRNWQSGQAPLTPEQFFQLGLDISGHSGTALTLCHNVAKAFARGGRAIGWEKRDRLRGEYFDGEETYFAVAFHRSSVLRALPNANPSLFFTLFSAQSLGSTDPAFWYRFFGSATACHYAASKATVSDSGHLSGAASDITIRLDAIGSLLPTATTDLRHISAGWCWANSLLIYELGTYGRSQEQAHAAARIFRRGATFGLRAAGLSTAPEQEWFIPRAGALISDAPPPAEWQQFVAEKLDRDGD